MFISANGGRRINVNHIRIINEAGANAPFTYEIETADGETYRTDDNIEDAVVQIIPAPGWYTVWKEEAKDRVVGWVTPLACWALTAEGSISGIEAPADDDPWTPPIDVTSGQFHEFVYCPDPTKVPKSGDPL